MDTNKTNKHYLKYFDKKTWQKHFLEEKKEKSKISEHQKLTK